MQIYLLTIVSQSKKSKIISNFNYKRIQSPYSNLSSLSIPELFELKNYKLLGYSTVEVDVHQKLALILCFFYL